MQLTDTTEEQTTETVDVDLSVALDVLVATWKESEGKSHVLVLRQDGLSGEYYVTRDMRSHHRHEDCVHVHELFEYSYIEDGEVVEHTTADTLTFGEDKYDVHLW